MYLDEAQVEIAAIEFFRGLGYRYMPGPEIAPGTLLAERENYRQVVLEKILREAVARLNPQIPSDARVEAVRKVLHLAGPSLVQTNRTFHGMLRDGVEVEYRRKDGSIAGERVRLIDFERTATNDFLVVNQFTVTPGRGAEGGQNRRADVVVFVNGLPLAVLELKNAADENTTIWDAFNQLQTYQQEIPQLFAYNELLVISDGGQARIGSLTADTEWFKVWRDGNAAGDGRAPSVQLDTLICGVFEKRRLLELVRHFIVFDEDPDSGKISKVIAGYHQVAAVDAAVMETLRAAGAADTDFDVKAGSAVGDRRIGVVWHTQGSGKSLSMLFYAGRIILCPSMENPTVVVLTDRNDLDDQLFGQFIRCHDILHQKPVQADSRADLRRLLNVASGGVVFTTIQKFLGARTSSSALEAERNAGADTRAPVSERRNIVVIADEAHRSQYAMIDGLAKHMRDTLPCASFIGFTGTPIEKNDANTRAVFGEYISVYDIQQAVEDKATVAIYYESRIAKLSLNQAALPKIDQEFEEITEGEEQQRKEKLKTKWAALESLVGDDDRIALVAEDLVKHYERRQEGLDGKAMIVCMSRRICVDLYNAIVKLRPGWASADGDSEEAERSRPCVMKIVMTGGADDGPEWQKHIRSKDARRKLAIRFKDPKDPFRIVIVRDMWLTGFDAPCLSTMYADKPMRGHGLMQAIARVNRVYRDKPGGLVVDYLGLADQLKYALSIYTQSGGQGTPAIDTETAIDLLREKYEVAKAILHGLDWSKWKTGKAAEKLALIPAGQEQVLRQENGKQRFIQVVAELSRAFALCAASDEAAELRDDISYFQAIRAQLAKTTASSKSPQELDAAIRQLVAKAIVPDGGIIDVFTAAGLPKPNISILSDQFMAEVRGLEHKNVAAELLAKLLRDEIRTIATRNIVQSRLFSDMLQTTLNAYHNRAIATQEVIEELIRLAKHMSEANKRGEELGLNEDEVAFYDALAANESAVKAMGVPELKVIAAELVTQVRKSVSIDWTLRESARAKIRVMVKRILKKHGYPPDLQDEATKTVLAQAELLCADLAA